MVTRRCSAASCWVVITFQFRQQRRDAGRSVAGDALGDNIFGAKQIRQAAEIQRHLAASLVVLAGLP